VPADQNPADVREEESASRIVGITVCVGVLVVGAGIKIPEVEFTKTITKELPMITTPLKDTRLESDRLEDDQHDFEWLVGFVGFVSEQAVSSCCDSQTTTQVDQGSLKENDVSTNQTVFHFNLPSNIENTEFIFKNNAHNAIA
jgi:hypothetical protein